MILLRERIEFLTDFFTDKLDRGQTFCDDILLFVEEEVAAGDAPFGEGDFDADKTRVRRTVFDIVFIGSVVEKRREKLQRIIMAVIGAQISEETISD